VTSAPIGNAGGGGASVQDVQNALDNLSTVGVGNSRVTGQDNNIFVVEFIGALANRDLPQMTVTNINLGGGAPNYTVNTNTNGGIFGSPTSSLENALNSLPGKPANLTFDVTGIPGNYVITFIDSNAIKTDI